jgi:hypothetical protein
MDVIAYRGAASTSSLDIFDAQVVGNLDTKMWVERYREPSEFTFTGRDIHNLKYVLALGTFVSHTKTGELMVVTGHEITQEKYTPAVITITGRSFLSHLDRRIVGSNIAVGDSTRQDYSIYNAKPGDAAVDIITKHIDPAEMLGIYGSSSGLDNIHAFNIVENPDIYDETQYDIPPKKLYEAVRDDILAPDDIGIRVLRPGSLSPSDQHLILIHDGVDRRKTVIFSHADSNYGRAQYLFSNESDYNAAYVTSRWLDRVVDHGYYGHKRKMVHVDASWIDNNLSEAPPPGPLRLAIFQALERLGEAAIARRPPTVMSQIEFSDTDGPRQVRVQYNVGDIVTLAGQYDGANAYRVVEYVEMEDDSGYKAYPTFGYLGD